MSIETSPWKPARRAERMNPSVLREILKVTDRPGIISLAGGLPSPDSFPVEAVREAATRVLRDTPRQALQYAASEGFEPLREWVAMQLRSEGHAVDADQVLITTGSQQGLDLAAKVLVDAGSRIAVESPTYLGALQAFAPYEPEFVSIACDDEGPIPERLDEARGASFLYALPNFQNPSGRTIGEARRAALIQKAAAIGLPILEDNPYGELWYDEPPPRALATRWPEGVIYLGSFSKVLAPGLRLGYVVAPRPLFPKLLQAKQAADLHTSGFVQRLAHEVIKDGLLETHLPAVRDRYRRQRDAMAIALRTHLPPNCRFDVPRGGMFFWVSLPAGVDAAALLPRAVERGMAFVPGEAFFAANPEKNRIRLSFVTASPEDIDRGIRLLAAALERRPAVA